jgi:acyl-CoA thioester hydrolase
MLVRVRYCECDPMGVAHHAAYLPWLEMARTELLREAGVTYAQLEAHGVFLVIVKLEASYKLPAYYDDLIEVRTRVVDPGSSRVKIRHEYQLVRAEAALRSPSSPAEVAVGTGGGTITPARSARVGDVVLTAATMLACIDRTGRPAPLPPWLAGGE